MECILHTVHCKPNTAPQYKPCRFARWSQNYSLEVSFIIPGAINWEIQGYSVNLFRHLVLLKYFVEEIEGQHVHITFMLQLQRNARNCFVVLLPIVAYLVVLLTIPQVPLFACLSTDMGRE